jgi:hypothetical protein
MPMVPNADSRSGGLGWLTSQGRTESKAANKVRRTPSPKQPHSLSRYFTNNQTAMHGPIIQSMRIADVLKSFIQQYDAFVGFLGGDQCLIWISRLMGGCYQGKPC